METNNNNVNNKKGLYLESLANDVGATDAVAVLASKHDEARRLEHHPAGDSSKPVDMSSSNPHHSMEPRIESPALSLGGMSNFDFLDFEGEDQNGRAFDGNDAGNDSDEDTEDNSKYKVARLKDPPPLALGENLADPLGNKTFSKIEQYHATIGDNHRATEAMKCLREVRETFQAKHKRSTKEAQNNYWPYWFKFVGMVQKRCQIKFLPTLLCLETPSNMKAGFIVNNHDYVYDYLEYTNNPRFRMANQVQIFIDFLTRRTTTPKASTNEGSLDPVLKLYRSKLSQYMSSNPHQTPLIRDKISQFNLHLADLESHLKNETKYDNAMAQKFTTALALFSKKILKKLWSDLEEPPGD